MMNQRMISFEKIPHESFISFTSFNYIFYYRKILSLFAFLFINIMGIIIVLLGLLTISHAMVGYRIG